MQRARFLADRERHLNIPDETDEEYIARMAAATKQFKISSTEKTCLNTENNASAAASITPLITEKLRTRTEEEGRDDDLEPTDPGHVSRVSNNFAVSHLALSPITSVKRKSQDTGPETLRTKVKKARYTCDSDPDQFSAPAAGAHPTASHDTLLGAQNEHRAPLDGDLASRLHRNGAARPASVSAPHPPLQLSSGVASPQSDESYINQTPRIDAISSLGSVRSNGRHFRAGVGHSPQENVARQEERKNPPPQADAVVRKKTNTDEGASACQSARKAPAGGKRVARDETPKKNAANESNVTTPGNSTLLEPTFSTVGTQNAQAGPSKPRKIASSRPTVPLTKGKSKKEKEPLMLPPGYVRWLQTKFDNGELKYSRSRFLQGKRIFFCNGDHQYATETTRKKMKLLLAYGATLLPEYDAARVTHIVTDTGLDNLLRACGVNKLEDIRADVPILKWSWAVSPLSSKSGKLAYWHNHATFKQRVLYDPEVEAQIKDHIVNATSSDRSTEKQKAAGRDENDSQIEEDLSRISEFTEADIPRPALPAAKPAVRQTSERPRLQFDVQPKNNAESRRSVAVPTATAASSKGDDRHDPLAEFYEHARAEREAEERREHFRWDIVDDNSDGENEPQLVCMPAGSTAAKTTKPVLKGFQCDQKAPIPSGPCPNQDIVDRLEELKSLHETKSSEHDHWRALAYRRAIPAVRKHPTRLTSYDEACKIPGVGSRTADKIMEIIKTGGLQRIEYERTKDVEVVRLFTGIYGVGRHTAYQWFINGCRTLEDVKAGKGDVKLSSMQKIGLKFYDDINTRMPRQEAKEIYDMIKPVALSLDKKLFIEIMGSFRRGKADCGDIDILITRPTDDGRTHRGILHRLLKQLREHGIVTEDLCVPDNWDDLELVYRGLCRKDENSPRRRIVPYKYRGAALLYYTGDDIFNRSMRLKANKMGYSLNQRGLYHNVIRNPSNKREKLEGGQILASESEQEIFAILGVPWQEPHERVRS